MVWSESGTPVRSSGSGQRAVHAPRIWSPMKDSLRSYSPLRETPREYFECLEDTDDCHDELFLLPEQVLDMDSDTVREDLCSIVPNGFKKPSPHNSLDSSDSGKSLKLAEDSDGFQLARASDDCKTFWLCETGTGMPGVMPSSMSQSLDTSAITQALKGDQSDNDKTDLMTSSVISLSGSSKQNLTKRVGHRNQTSQNWFLFEEGEATEGRAEIAQREREREERLRKIKEQQEEERKRKLEELKLHALQAQKFREQQEAERRRHIEEHRSRDMDRRQQVEERRKEIEKAEQERREAILARNKERDQRMEMQRRNSRSNLDFAFGSSAPRLIDRPDSAYFARRSTSTTNMVSSMYERRSMDRDTDSSGQLVRSKRTSSAQGLDRSNEGDDNGLGAGGSGGGGAMSASVHANWGAHRRRTDLIPTIVAPGTSRDRSAGGSRTPGLSRENSTASRPGSAMSGRTVGSSSATGPVRMRSAPSRRPRPLSIATTGMTASMYEERGHSKPQLRQKPLSTPKVERMKRARSVTSDQVSHMDDESGSVSSSASGPASSSRPGSAVRKTPAQVKAEAAARKSKVMSRSVGPLPSTPKSSHSPSTKNIIKKVGSTGGSLSSQSPSPALSTDQLNQQQEPSPAAASGDPTGGKRQITPDIIKDNNGKVQDPSPTPDASLEPAEQPAAGIEADNGEEQSQGGVKDADAANGAAGAKKIISSEEEAKARIAEKRREMRERMEREAELERQRKEEEARLEAERIAREEEEQRRMEEESERLAAEARQAEEERIQKAIQEKEAEERRMREEEERVKKEKEEVERKAREEAERREAELQEKLRKEEEERLARKKRIEEIMARTRNKGASTPTSTPKKEVESNGEAAESQSNSFNSNADPTKPDLLGNIGEAHNNNNNTSATADQATAEKNARNLAAMEQEEGEDNASHVKPENGVDSDEKEEPELVDTSSSHQEAAAAPKEEEEQQQEQQPSAPQNGGDSSDSDMRSTSPAHDAESTSSSPAPETVTINNEQETNHLVEMEKGVLESYTDEKETDAKLEASQSDNSINNKHQSPFIESADSSTKMSAIEAEFDQILDLGSLPESGTPHAETNGQQPIIAFESNSNQTADLLS